MSKTCIFVQSTEAGRSPFTSSENTEISGDTDGLSSLIPTFVSSTTAYPLMNVDAEYRHTAGVLHPMAMIPITESRVLQLRCLVLFAWNVARWSHRSLH